MVDDACMLCCSHGISLETCIFHIFTQVGNLCLKLHPLRNYKIITFAVLTKKERKVQKGYMKGKKVERFPVVNDKEMLD
jgi:hypothetical protein